MAGELPVPVRVTVVSAFWSAVIKSLAPGRFKSMTRIAVSRLSPRFRSRSLSVTVPMCPVGPAASNKTSPTLMSNVEVLLMFTVTSSVCFLLTSSMLLLTTLKNEVSCRPLNPEKVLVTSKPKVRAVFAGVFPKRVGILKVAPRVPKRRRFLDSEVTRAMRREEKWLRASSGIGIETGLNEVVTAVPLAVATFGSVLILPTVTPLSYEYREYRDSHDLIELVFFFFDSSYSACETCDIILTIMSTSILIEVTVGVKPRSIMVPTILFEDTIGAH